jgi:hypothetical protein
MQVIHFSPHLSVENSSLQYGHSASLSLSSSSVSTRMGSSKTSSESDVSDSVISCFLFLVDPLVASCFPLRGWFCFSPASFFSLPAFFLSLAAFFPRSSVSYFLWGELVIRAAAPHLDDRRLPEVLWAVALWISGIGLISEGIKSFDEVSSEFRIVTLETRGWNMLLGPGRACSCSSLTFRIWISCRNSDSSRMRLL